MKTVCSREDDPLASACLQGVLQNVYHSAYGMGERERGAASEAGTPSPVLDCFQLSVLEAVFRYLLWDPLVSSPLAPRA